MHVIEMILEHEIDDYCWLTIETINNEKIETHEIECTENGLLVNDTITIERAGKPVELHRGLIRYEDVKSIYKHVKDVYIYQAGNSDAFLD